MILYPYWLKHSSQAKLGLRNLGQAFLQVGKQCPIHSIPDISYLIHRATSSREPLLAEEFGKLRIFPLCPVHD